MAPIKKGVEFKRIKLRRYQQYHDKFISYPSIQVFLQELKSEYPNQISLRIIGQSKQGRNIIMAIICSEHCERNDSPKFGIMIEAGSNGEEWLTISSALYIIEALVKKKGVLLTDYYIIPCSNPDAYEATLEMRMKGLTVVPCGIKMDFSRNYPVTIGLIDDKNLDNSKWFQVVKEHKENIVFNAPESNAVAAAIDQYKFCIRMFISLQAKGESILYPFGCSDGRIIDEDDLKKGAVLGKYGFKDKVLKSGSIYEVQGVTLGNIADYIRIYQSCIKFAYIFNIHHPCKSPSKDKILRMGEDVSNSIKYMSSFVFMFYNKYKTANFQTETKNLTKKK